MKQKRHINIAALEGSVINVTLLMTTKKAGACAADAGRNAGTENWGFIRLYGASTWGKLGFMRAPGLYWMRLRVKNIKTSLHLECSRYETEMNMEKT